MAWGWQNRAGNEKAKGLVHGESLRRPFKWGVEEREKEIEWSKNKKEEKIKRGTSRSSLWTALAEVEKES